MKIVYLDNNASTQVAPEVLTEMVPYFHEFYGNPSSIHSFGGHVANKVTEAREKVAALLGAEPDEIIFTSCGTESRAGILGRGRPWKLAAQRLDTENIRVRQLRDRLEAGIQEQIPHIRINGGKTDRLPNTSNISFQFVDSEAILLLLDQLGICASSASACTAGSTEPSRVLRAMGLPYAMARGSVRFSLSIYNTAEEIDYVTENLPAIIRRLREMSPNWKASSAHVNA